VFSGYRSALSPLLFFYVCCVLVYVSVGVEDS